MNAVDELLHRELAELFRYLAVGEDELIAGARAIVLTGHGPAFSAGVTCHGFHSSVHPIASIGCGVKASRSSGISSISSHRSFVR